MYIQLARSYGSLARSLSYGTTLMQPITFAPNLSAVPQLDLLGIVAWHARAYDGVPLRAPPEAVAALSSTTPIERWRRILRRVAGLVRRIVDFGVFVQVYVAAAEKEKLVAVSATEAVEEGETRGNKKVRGGRRARAASSLRKNKQENRNCELDLTDNCNRDRRSSLKSPERDAETLTHHQREGSKEEQVGRYPLMWLFPDTKEGGRQAFNRHVLCGGAAHSFITLDASLTIIRDAGKLLSVERAWRWCCESGVLRGGRLLAFQSFVDMCEALKDHMADASIMSQEDHTTDALDMSHENHGATTAAPLFEAAGLQGVPQDSTTGDSENVG